MTNPLHKFAIFPSNFNQEDLVFAAVDLPNPDPQEPPCELYVACSSVATGMRVREELKEFAIWQNA
jgi:hypothetical protein